MKYDPTRATIIIMIRGRVRSMSCASYLLLMQPSFGQKIVPSSSQCSKAALT